MRQGWSNINLLLTVNQNLWNVLILVNYEYGTSGIILVHLLAMRALYARDKLETFFVQG